MHRGFLFKILVYLIGNYFSFAYLDIYLKKKSWKGQGLFYIFLFIITYLYSFHNYSKISRNSTPSRESTFLFALPHGQHFFEFLFQLSSTFFSQALFAFFAFFLWNKVAALLFRFKLLCMLSTLGKMVI